MATNEQVCGGLLGLHALTSLHPGSGAALGTVDLPVQRERHTQWPIIPGSTLKGVLRDACRERVKGKYEDDSDSEGGDGGRRLTRRQKADETDAEVLAAFGPAAVNADKHAGALSLTDARMLGFPVRSLKGVFAWVSCPAALQRLQRDAALALTETNWPIAEVHNNHAVAPKDCPCVVKGKKGQSVVLEEFDFAVDEQDLGAITSWIIEHILPDGPEHKTTADRFATHFVILADDDFTHFVRNATEVTARIGLNYETKTVQQGALFYQEFLPPETILYSVVRANATRQGNGSSRDAAGVLRILKDSLPAVLQVGGDETTGKGFCATMLGQSGEATPCQ